VISHLTINERYHNSPLCWIVLLQSILKNIERNLRVSPLHYPVKKTNVPFAERTISSIDNSMMVSRGGVSKILYHLTNGAPILAVYSALVSSLISYFILLLIYKLVDYFGGLPGLLWASGQEFLITVTFAFLGAIVSIAFRLELPQIERVGLMPLFLTNLVKPYIGAMFGIVVFCIIQSQIIKISGVNDTPISTVAMSPGDNELVWFQGRKILVHDYLFFFISALLGFLSGFSERFATDLINRSSQLFGSSPSGNSPGR
jgi:hypothetical protein